ncbi:MAG: hypothetical protein J6P89_06630 [Oscillospiraceae bacterium]|nr:hypothetical protein [Oscillospiraceae bacterium]
MGQNNQLTKRMRNWIEDFAEGFVASLSTQEVLDRSRFDELVYMMTTDCHVSEDIIKQYCEEAYQCRQNCIHFYLDIHMSDENDEKKLLETVAEAVPGVNIVPLVMIDLYSLYKDPYLTDDDLHVIARKLVEVFPTHPFFLDRIRYDPFTTAKIGELRIAYDTHEMKVRNEEFIW